MPVGSGLAGWFVWHLHARADRDLVFQDSGVFSGSNLPVATPRCHAFGVQAPSFRLVAAVFGALSGLGCRASVQGDASAEVAADSTDAELDAEIQKERALSSSESPDGGTDVEIVSSGQVPLLGARRDLALASDRASLTCSCLKLGLGQPSDAAFRWKGTAPTIDASSQLVVALSSQGMTCKELKGSQGASYWGYRRSGNDVLVFVESAIKNRPVTAGAIIPKPFGDGQVYAAPAFRREPYGRGPNGESRCKLGNPGPPRSSPPPETDTVQSD